jgi:hypothetical protein
MTSRAILVEPPTPLWLRTPEQLLYIGMIWWTSIKGHPKEAGRLRAQESVAERKHASREGATS